MLTSFADRCRIAVICAVCLLSAHVAEAQRSRRGAIMQVARQLQREIKEIQKELPEAQEELGKAEKSLGQAQVQFRRAQAELEQARRSLNERLGPKVGLPDALADSDRTRKEYDRASKLFVQGHRDDESFQQLQQDYVTADDRLDAFRKSIATNDAVRKDQLAALTRTAHEAREAYQSRIDSDSTVQPSRGAWLKSEFKLGEVRKKLSQEAKEDSEVKAAESGFKQAKSVLEQAQMVAEVAGTKVGLMQERIATNLTLLGY